MAFVSTTQVASNEPFDNSTNGFTATNTQAAIEEAKNTAEGKTRINLICGYGGQAKGQYLEFFKGLGSDSNPFIIPTTMTLKEISVSLKYGSTATGTFEIRKNGAVVKTITITATRYFESGITISFSAIDRLSVNGDSIGGTSLSDPIFSMSLSLV